MSLLAMGFIKRLQGKSVCFITSRGYLRSSIQRELITFGNYSFEFMCPAEDIESRYPNADLYLIDEADEILS
jgi:hypothetical protein